MAMPLSAMEIAYRAFQQATIDYDPTYSWSEEDDKFP